MTVMHVLLCKHHTYFVNELPVAHIHRYVAMYGNVFKKGCMSCRLPAGQHTHAAAGALFEYGPTAVMRVCTYRTRKCLFSASDLKQHPAQAAGSKMLHAE